MNEIRVWMVELDFYLSLKEHDEKKHIHVLDHTTFLPVRLI